MKKIIYYLSSVLLAAALISSCSSYEQQSTQTLSPEQIKIIFSPAGNTIGGNPQGKITIVDFFSYECPNCRALNPVLNQLIKQNNDVRVVYKEFLLFGDKSIPAASAALAAQKQGKYLLMHDALITSKKPLTLTEVIHIAQRLGLDTVKLKADMQSPEVLTQLKINTDLAYNQIKMDYAPTLLIAPTDIIIDPNRKLYQSSGVITLSQIQQLINAARNDH